MWNLLMQIFSTNFSHTQLGVQVHTRRTDKVPGLKSSKCHWWWQKEHPAITASQKSCSFGTIVENPSAAQTTATVRAEVKSASPHTKLELGTSLTGHDTKCYIYSIDDGVISRQTADLYHIFMNFR